MRVPIWLPLAVAALVAGFGCYRVWLAFKKPAQESDDKRSNDVPTKPGLSIDLRTPSAGVLRTPAKPGLSILGGGMYRMSPRMHLAIGVIYILLGTALGATAFGWNPLKGALG